MIILELNKPAALCRHKPNSIMSILKTINFKIKGRHISCEDEATIVEDYNEGTLIALNDIPGDMDDLKTNYIGTVDGYGIYENYYDSGSVDYFYFAVKNVI